MTRPPVYVDIEFDKGIFLPCYRHLIDREDDIVFLWGGRDSGKSHFIAQRLIMKCLEAPYFRCVLIKNTYESIRDSQWQTLKDIVDEMGLSHLFTFTRSPIEITCINGNKFIARGCDKPEKLKSIRNPSDAWFEEGNQITREQYTTISTTLRSEKSDVQEWFSFNPEADGNYEDFWLYKDYDLSHYGDKDYRGSIEVTLPTGEKLAVRYTSCHTTYDDNLYVTAKRKAKHEALQYTDPYYYDVYRHGLWGNRKVEDPFAYSFDRKKHTSSQAKYDPKKLLFASIDFNLDPFSAIFAHIWTDNEGAHCHVFEEVAIKGGSIEKMADYIKRRFPDQLRSMTITGDAAGLARSITERDNANLYQQLVTQLKISFRQVKVSSNPTHKKSREDTNYFLHHYPDFRIHPTNCPLTVRDLEMVEVDLYGKIKKKDRKDPNQRSDFLDDIRYLVHTFFSGWIKYHQKTVN